MKDAEELVRKTFELFNSNDIGALRELYAEDSWEQDMCTGERTEGRDGVIEALLGFKKALPDLRANIRHLHSAGNTVFAEATFTGTHTAPLEWGEQPLAPTHRVLTLHVIEVMETGGGKIRGIRIYYDTGAITNQLMG